MKNHSLPELSFGKLAGDTVESMMGVDAEGLNNKIRDYLDKNVQVGEVFDSTKLDFTNKMNDFVFKAMIDMYDSFSDRELIYTLWTHMDAIMRMAVIEKVEGDVEI
jgi:hypothetical protein